MKLAQKLAIRYIRARLHVLALVSEKKAAAKALQLFSTPMQQSKARTSAVFEKGTVLSFKLEGHTIRGHRWMPEGPPPTRKVLMLHGFQSASKNFEKYIPGLLGKNYEVLAFDAPGHGESGGKLLNLPLYIGMIRKIVEKYGPVESFLAHSFGGMAVMHWLEKVAHSADTRVALVAPATETKTAIDMFFYFLQLEPGVRKEFDKLIFERTGFQTEELSIRRAMHQISASVLWIHDENDDVTPLPDALKVRDDHHSNLEFIITKKLGHRKIYRDSGVMKKNYLFFIKDDQLFLPPSIGTNEKLSYISSARE